MDFSKFNISDIERTLFFIQIDLLNSFQKLSLPQQEIASYGIQRHLYYSNRGGSDPDIKALKEIIQDAKIELNLSKENQASLEKRKGSIDLSFEREYRNIVQEKITNDTENLSGF